MASGHVLERVHPYSDVHLSFLLLSPSVSLAPSLSFSAILATVILFIIPFDRYLYYALKTLGYEVWWGPYLTILQIYQVDDRSKLLFFDFSAIF